MKENKLPTIEEIERTKVVLKPVFGISPRTYLPIIYGILALAVLFLLLIYPGITNNGSVLVFRGEPAVAAVSIDGAYRTDTGSPIFIKSGNHTIRFEYAGFSPLEQNVAVKGRVLGSLFFPRKQIISYQMQADNPGQLVEDSFSAFSAWSLTGKPSALYQLPPVISEPIGNLASAGLLKSSDGLLKPSANAGMTPETAFARDLAGSAASAEAARDALRAGVLVLSHGQPGPLGMIAALRTAASIAGSDKGASVYLYELLGKSAGKYLEKLSALKNETAAFSASPTKPLPSGRFQLAGVTFVMFSKTSFRMTGETLSGNKFPYTVSVPEFGLAATEITKNQWKLFMAENPSWSLKNRDALIQQHLVDEDYLSTWAETGDSAPIRSISWHAAAAYCAWLSGKAGSGYSVILPTEAMWESAAVANNGYDFSAQAVWAGSELTGPLPVASRGYGSAGLADMGGNVWEWTGDSYRAYPALSAGTYPAAEKAVRGGSWGNAEGTIKPTSRGVIPAERCSAFLGFRPAIVKK
ncbi:MAG: SUMF1/EgtB/PvdO family nonheme iron enzyme [Spirochaetia bacterium]|nr:SUMF1/EgtB/PvdO family nonheme iron enzyme [Spirochaetia bacterium]